MDWTEYLESDTSRLGGKPVVKGTRLGGDFIPGLFACGWTEQQVLENYPRLDKDALRAMFVFADGAR